MSALRFSTDLPARTGRLRAKAVCRFTSPVRSIRSGRAFFFQVGRFFENNNAQGAM